MYLTLYLVTTIISLLFAKAIDNQRYWLQVSKELQVNEKALETYRELFNALPTISNVRKQMRITTVVLALVPVLNLLNIVTYLRIAYERKNY